LTSHPAVVRGRSHGTTDVAWVVNHRLSFGSVGPKTNPFKQSHQLVKIVLEDSAVAVAKQAVICIDEHLPVAHFDVETVDGLIRRTTRD
jgi:uncharacterized protein (DUF427 family)